MGPNGHESYRHTVTTIQTQAPQDEDLLPRTIERVTSGTGALLEPSLVPVGASPPGGHVRRAPSVHTLLLLFVVARVLCGPPRARRTRLRLGPESTVEGPGRSSDRPTSAEGRSRQERLPVRHDAGYRRSMVGGDVLCSGRWTRR